LKSFFKTFGLNISKEFFCQKHFKTKLKSNNKNGKKISNKRDKLSEIVQNYSKILLSLTLKSRTSKNWVKSQKERPQSNSRKEKQIKVKKKPRERQNNLKKPAAPRNSKQKKKKEIKKECLRYFLS
jgi:hypothetical protein